MQLTAHTDYALRVLIYLTSNPSRTISTREIANAYGISLNHLTKVAKSLVKGGWLISTRGAGGGLVLAPHTLGTRLGDIVRHTENLPIALCFTAKRPNCPIAAVCQLKSVLHRARQAFFDVLDHVTVGEICSNPAEINLILSQPRPARRRRKADPHA